MRKRRHARGGWAYLALLITSCFALFPFFWVVMTSLKSTGEVFQAPPTFWPSHLSLAAYGQVFSQTGFPVDFLNSLAVALCTTLIALFLATLAGYGFSRFRLPGGRAMMLGILFTQMFPAILLLIPLYVLLRAYHLLNSLQGLVVAYGTFALPLCVWIMRNYLVSVPLELDEAAMVDGCSRLGALWRVIVPVAKPGLTSTAIFSFITAWDEFMFANTFINSPRLFTLPLGLQSFIGQYSTHWNLLSAGSVIVTVPVVVLVLLAQKHLVSGLAAGSVKG